MHNNQKEEVLGPRVLWGQQTLPACRGLCQSTDVQNVLRKSVDFLPVDTGGVGGIQVVTQGWMNVSELRSETGSGIWAFGWVISSVH